MTSPDKVATEPDIADNAGEAVSSSTMWPCTSLPVTTSLARSSVYSSVDSSPEGSSRFETLEGPFVTGSLGIVFRAVGGEADSSLVDWFRGLDPRSR